MQNIFSKSYSKEEFESGSIPLTSFLLHNVSSGMVFESVYDLIYCGDSEDTGRSYAPIVHSIFGPKILLNIMFDAHHTTFNLARFSETSSRDHKRWFESSVFDHSCCCFLGVSHEQSLPSP